MTALKLLRTIGSAPAGAVLRAIQPVVVHHFRYGGPIALQAGAILQVFSPALRVNSSIGAIADIGGRLCTCRIELDEYHAFELVTLPQRVQPLPEVYDDGIRL
jgi:hypothetical protein